jgi:hypothetical protein
MGDYKFKFLFANHDGVSVEAEFPETMKVSQVKEQLLSSHWPEDKVEKVSSPAGLRLLCMGRMLEDGKTLADMKIPKYDHATPVNVSLLPKGKTYSENNVPGNSSPSLKASASHTVGGASASAAGGARANAGGGGCCTIN